MSLRDKLKAQESTAPRAELFRRFGIAYNPFPSSGQTANNPHLITSADEEAETRILSFLRDGRSQVVVVEGTQGVGKTNFLSHFEAEIQDTVREMPGYYVVRYLADPEASFDGTVRRLIQEIGPSNIRLLASKIYEDPNILRDVRIPDVRAGLLSISGSNNQTQISEQFMDWLLGSRVLKAHREFLGVQFRLETVESRTAALRDLVVASSAAGILNGIFLLLDELEKQDGALGPTAIVRYLSALRAIIDALPRHLFMMIAITPDALRRYSSAVPAFRSRLQNQITLLPLADADGGVELAKFYLNRAREDSKASNSGTRGGNAELVSVEEIRAAFERLRRAAERRGSTGVPQRDFLHELHRLAEETIQSGSH